MERENRIPIGVFYKKEREDFVKAFPMLMKGPLVKQRINNVKIGKLFQAHK
jgi:hypothetical protein